MVDAQLVDQIEHRFLGRPLERAARVERHVGALEHLSGHHHRSAVPQTAAAEMGRMHLQVGNRVHHAGKAFRGAVVVALVAHMEEHRQAALGGAAVERHHARVVQIEFLHVGMQLDADESQALHLIEHGTEIFAVLMGRSQADELGVCGYLFGYELVDAAHLGSFGGHAEHEEAVDAHLRRAVEHLLRRGVRVVHLHVEGGFVVKRADCSRRLRGDLLLVDMAMGIGHTVGEAVGCGNSHNVPLSSPRG